ncbi:MAG: CopD family protein [Acidobacteriaceae bacterium]|nr:CopD family protein [Acidobacteriota bacterium]MBV9503105.1 CopD family protein [Acidobacteriaceae bacterium]
MAQILDLYGFFAVVLLGLTLAFEAFTVGGVVFLWLVDSLEPAEPAVTIRCRRLLRIVAFALGIAAVFAIVLTTLVLRGTTDGFRWIDTTSTSFSRAELLIAAGGVWIAICSKTISARWLLAPAAGVIIGTTLTSHAFARIENRPSLLFCTGLHLLATAAWIGGLPSLLIALRRGSERFALRAARRFSQLAVASVAILVSAGVVLGREYVGDVQAIYGTSYGVMLAAKVVLLIVLLGLGAINFRLLRRQGKAQSAIRNTVRRIVEVEAAVGISVIVVASSMASQAPAVDFPEGRVSLSESADRFTPQWPPRLQTPPPAALSPATPLSVEEAKRFGRALSYSTSAQPTLNTPADIAWSEYNHNWAGLCVLAAGLLALIAQMRHGHWARHWPLAFLGLAAFIVIRADPENWPLGPRGFWESFQVPDVVQHRLAAALVAAFAIFEWRVTTGRTRQSWHALVFPAICMIGGALLFAHSHRLGNVREELLAEESHTGIAIFAIVAAAARWLELRLPRGPALLGFVWAACFVIIGVMLTFYREA